MIQRRQARLRVSLDVRGAGQVHVHDRGMTVKGLAVVLVLDPLVLVVEGTREESLGQCQGRYVRE
jgi:hypothetical protein